MPCETVHCGPDAGRVPVHTAPMKNLLLNWCGAAILAMGSAVAHAQPTALQPIASLDVPRYMGTWFEIAKYPNSFQKNACAIPAPNTKPSRTALCRC